MRKFDWGLAAAGLIYVMLAAALWFMADDRPDQNAPHGLEEGSRTAGREAARQAMAYKVEINQVMQALETAGAFSAPDLSGMEYIKAVAFLPAENASEQELRAFYRNRNGMHMTIRPLMAEGRADGFVRFDYMTGPGNVRLLYLTEGVLFVAWILLCAALWYVRQKIIKPFHVLSLMPYELARGNLQWELEENKSRFFGKFVWGVGMLQDALRTSRNQALRLEKEKKLLLLSLSHDIKIPLSAIKLYAKALREGVYGTEAEKICGARQIEKHALEIEAFVKDIVDAAGGDVAGWGMKQPEEGERGARMEFYLKDFVEKVRECYTPKCKLLMTDFRIGAYEDKMVKGDPDRAFEVMENLMENAFKYGDGKEICLKFREEDYCQIIELYNSGEAVTADEMPHLFDSFYRGSNAGEKAGNGLGLYIGRQLMRRMEGDIFAVREAGGMRLCLVFREDF